MKRIVFILLLAMATIFAAISCKSVISGGPGVPQEPGDYIRVGGQSFQKVSDDHKIVSMVYKDVTPEEFAQKAIPIPAGCTTIEYACRLTPTQTQDARSGGFLAQSNFSDIRIMSGRTVDPHGLGGYKTYIDTGYGCVYASDAEDHSQYKDGDAYVLLVFKLPVSPEGKYFLYPYESGDWILLQGAPNGELPRPVAQVQPPSSIPSVPAGMLVCNLFYENVKNVTRGETRWTHNTGAAVGDRLSFLLYMELTNSSVGQNLIATLTNQLGEGLQYIGQSSYVRVNDGNQQPMPDNWITREYSIDVSPQVNPQRPASVEITFDVQVVGNRSSSASSALKFSNSTETDTAYIGIH